MTGVVGNYVCARTQCAHVYLKNIGDKKKEEYKNKANKMNKQKGYPIAHSTPLLKLFSDIFQNKYNMFYNFVTGENFNCCLKNTFL